jgi:hypothetical protein
VSADVLAIVLDYLGEGPIAFPELQENIAQAGIAEGDAAIDLAQRALLALRDRGELVIHEGRAYDSELPMVTTVRAKQLLLDHETYRYGDGDEVRAWFSVPAGQPNES